MSFNDVFPIQRTLFYPLSILARTSPRRGDNLPFPRYAGFGLGGQAPLQPFNPGVWMFSVSLDFVGTLRRGDAR